MEIELGRILASRYFTQSERMRRFLAFSVSRALADDLEALKEYTIGLEVFDRPSDYDPRIDSIVRVEARRLRKKLRQYYESEGRASDLQITLPEGSYAPVFVPARTAEAPAAPIQIAMQQPEIAVLPFRPIPAGERGQQFADGLAEELINILSGVMGLRVVARSTVSQVGGSMSAAEAGRKLGVERVLEGVVRHDNNEARISAQLIEVNSATAIWGQAWSGSLGEPFLLQENVAKGIATALRAKLRGEASQRDVISAAAYQQLLEGRHYASLLTPTALRRSMESFQRAIQAESEYAAAHAAMAGAILQLSLFGDTSPRTIIVEANVSIFRALQADPELPAAHLWRGLMNAIYRWHWDEAEVDFQRALELDPNRTAARAYYAMSVMTPQGRFDEALAHLRVAERMDSASILVHTCLGLVHLLRGEFSEAIVHLRMATTFNPRFYGAAKGLAFAHFYQGDQEQAFHTLRTAQPEGATDAHILGTLGYLLAQAGRPVEARAIMDRMLAEAERAYVPPYDLALLYLGRGDFDIAMQYLKQAVYDHEPWLVMVSVDPIFLPLAKREDFQAIVRTIFPPDPA